MLVLQGMQSASDLPAGAASAAAAGAAAAMPPPAGPPAFLQTSFGEVLAARVAGGAPKGSPFCTALQVDGAFGMGCEPAGRVWTGL